MKTKYTTLAVIGSVLLMSPMASAVELLTNGDFESMPNWGMGFAGDAGYTGLTGTQIPGWTIEAGHGATVHNTVLYPTISGNYSINTDGEGFMSQNADMYQDFATVNGQLYAFSFDWKGWFADFTPRLDVSLTDLSTNSQFYSYNSSYSAALTHVTYAFVGSGNVVRVRIKESPQSGYNDNAFIVDNFSVTTVPEPATISSIALGLMALARRRNRQN